jgi:ABC-type amino acid transport substrate-binding protein
MKKFLLVVLIGIVVLAGVWAGGKRDQGPAEPEEARPVVKIASNVGIPTIYKKGTEITGYEYELVKEAFDRMGYDIEIVDVAFAGIFAGLMAEKWDMCVSSIYLTKAREEEMDFTDPYLEGFAAIVALADSDLDGVEDLKGKKIAAEAGTSSAAFLAGFEGRYGPFETLGYDDKQTMFLDLENGRVQALTTGIMDVVKQEREDPGMLKVVVTSDDNYMIAGAVRTGDSIRNIFNEGLNSMKKDGTLRKLYETHMALPVPEGAQFIEVFTTPYVPTK